MATDGLEVKEGMILPEKTNNIRKGHVIMLGGYPCKVMEMKKSKPGKHGACKTHVVGLDIFTGKKHDEILRGEAQVVVNDKYQQLLLNIEGDQLSTLTDTGETRNDLNMPEGELADKLREAFDGGMQVNVTILKALGREAIIAFAEDKT
jgi:translation initiation factor 5A